VIVVVDEIIVIIFPEEMKYPTLAPRAREIMVTRAINPTSCFFCNVSLSSPISSYMNVKHTRT
jgi:hypothetical protein